jgi:hypothetical protein
MSLDVLKNYKKTLGLDNHNNSEHKHNDHKNNILLS